MKIPPKLTKLTITRCVEAIGLPVEQWSGRCHFVACSINRRLKLNLQERYGIYTGPIADSSPFAGRSFARHGWLEDPKNQCIVDPTFWVFTDASPFVRVCSSECADYDFAANAFREPLFDGGRGVPKFEEPSQEELKEYPGREPKTLVVKDEKARVFLKSKLDRFPRISAAQAMWLGRLSIKELGAQAKPIYDALVAAGLSAMIPYDHRVVVLQKGRY